MITVKEACEIASKNKPKEKIPKWNIWDEFQLFRFNITIRFFARKGMNGIYVESIRPLVGKKLREMGDETNEYGDRDNWIMWDY